MVYKFRIVSDEVDSFKLEIMIDSDDNFLRLRNVILESVGYRKDEIDSFFICDEEWNKQQEITLMEMDTDSTEDSWVMEDTRIEELIEEEGQKLIFTFDYFNDRSFFMEMNEMITGKSLSEPYCSRKIGNAPEQKIEMDAFDVKAVITPAEDLDEEFYGSSEYAEDEIESLDNIADSL